MAKNVFVICFVLSFVGNVLTDLPEKYPEEMIGPNTFETIEKMVAGMVETRVAEMVETSQFNIETYYMCFLL